MKTMKQQQHNQLISFLQTFGIWLVVIGHSFYGYYYVCGNETNYLFSWIYSFHMPLFMSISGYLLAYTSRQKRLSPGTMTWNEIGKFIMKKAKRLLIPYVVISSIVFIPKVLLNQFAIHPVDGSLLDYIEMIVMPERNAISYFWFLPVLFIIFCATTISAKILNTLKIRHMPPAIVLAVLAVPHIACPWDYIDLLGISKAINYIVFFAAGYYFCTHGMETLFCRYRTAILACTLPASLALLLIPYFHGLELLTAFTGMAMSISMGQIYINRGWHFFSHSEGASYAIYLFSWFPQVASQNMLYALLPQCPWQASTVLAAITGFYVPLAIYRLIMRYRRTPTGRVIALLTGQ